MFSATINKTVSFRQTRNWKDGEEKWIKALANARKTVTESKDFEELTWKRERIAKQILSSDNYATWQGGWMKRFKVCIFLIQTFSDGKIRRRKVLWQYLEASGAACIWHTNHLRITELLFWKKAFRNDNVRNSDLSGVVFLKCTVTWRKFL